MDVKRRLGRLYDLAETTDLDIDDFKPRISTGSGRRGLRPRPGGEGDAPSAARSYDVETITAYALDMSMFLNESEDGAQGLHRDFVKEIVVMPDNALGATPRCPTIAPYRE